jgi:hypothetical protein
MTTRRTPTGFSAARGYGEGRWPCQLEPRKRSPLSLSLLTVSARLVCLSAVCRSPPPRPLPVRDSLHRARRVKAAQVVSGVVGARLLGLDTPCYTGCLAREAASNVLYRGNDHCVSSEEERTSLSHAKDSARPWFCSGLSVREKVARRIFEFLAH